MTTPADYLERVYAGVLGKIIGVYLGRPIEGWTYEQIATTLGEIRYYVNDLLGQRLIVTDDDITGTFTFPRSLADFGASSKLKASQIGQTWLNYIIEGRTILWWGGLGNSTEHTAYLRLKRGIPAPESGSSRLNSKTVAEQIGAQIFVDGWAMVAPGNPSVAAGLAKEAASVSHDGEAVHAAVFLAAMEALAFVESDIDRLIEVAFEFIPRNCVIRGLVDDLCHWRRDEPDWRRARVRLADKYGYDRFGGNCHVVPNHGLIILGLLYGGSDFHKSMLITNTSGWDTDCNSGNLGCLLGIKNGLRAFDGGPDWRGPVADRLYLATADGGEAVTDAASQAVRIANLGRSLSGEPPLRIKEGARFHFELPGSVQGFRADDRGLGGSSVSVKNTIGHSLAGRRSLAVRFQELPPGEQVRVITDTFIRPQDLDMPCYPLLASPTLYPGQTIFARLSADEDNWVNMRCRLTVAVYGAKDGLTIMQGPDAELPPGGQTLLEWQILDPEATPIVDVGIGLDSDSLASGAVYIDYLTWHGEPRVSLVRAQHGGNLWRRAWVDGVDQFLPDTPEPIRVVQNRGRGLLIQGTREWRDFQAQARIAVRVVSAGGIAARVQGMCRYYALLLVKGGRVQLQRVVGEAAVLCEETLAWEPDRSYDLALEVQGQDLRAWLDNKLIFDLHDGCPDLDAGGVALVCEEGCLSCTDFWVGPATGGPSVAGRQAHGARAATGGDSDCIAHTL